MSKKVVIIIIGVFVLIMGMMGAGFFVLWNQMSNTFAQVQQQNNDDTADEQEEESENEIVVGPMYKLDTMIVNLADKGGKRYLRVTMELELKVPEEMEAAEVISEIEMRMPQLRDSILMILPSKQYTDISTTDGKIQLRDELMARLNGYLKKGQIGNIYFTEFVVQ